MNSTINCPHTEISVSARLADVLTLPISNDAELPSDIQWMPPGSHEIWPQGFDAPFNIAVTPLIAEVANAQLQQMRRMAVDGQGNWPYADFNHEDREQSFEPLEFFWGGDDAKTGGVRVRARWSGAGETAVRGRAFRSFSPSWRLNNETRQFLGIGLNIGGLVNRSAFTAIQAVARGATNDTTNKQQPDPMTEQDRREISDMIINAVKPITDQLTTLTNARQAIQANARKTVEEIGVKAGRIASQDKDTIDWWTHAIAADAKAADALVRMPQNPAFLTVVRGGSQLTHTSTIQDTTAEGFVQLVQAKCARGKSKAEAIDLAINENLEAYSAWRAANGQPSL